MLRYGFIILVIIILIWFAPKLLIIVAIIAYILVGGPVYKSGGGDKSKGRGINKGRDNILNDSVLSREYLRWDITRQQLVIITSGLDKKKAYEAGNILERWKLSGENFGTGESFGTGNATDKMKSELVEKGITDDPDSVVEKIIAVKSRPGIGTPIIHNSGLIKYLDYERVLSRDRVQLLRKYGSNEEIAACAMRYSSIVSGGQQWNIPRAVYKILVEKYGVRLEGFASPINSQLLRFRPKYPDIRFCSLFPDVDKPFGSIGSFFDCDLRGIVSTVNPPYVLDIMNQTAKKAVADLETSTPTRVFMTVPNWTDAEYYNILSNSKHLEAKLVHNPGEYYYEDSNNNDKRVIARFASTLFVLSNMTPNDYEDINRAFKV